MRSLIFRTALAALLISTPFASAFARGGGMGGGFHSAQSIGSARQNSNSMALRLRSNVGTPGQSFTSGSRLDLNSVSQSTATPGNTAIRVH
jgi:hypothetical protein